MEQAKVIKISNNCGGKKGGCDVQPYLLPNLEKDKVKYSPLIIKDPKLRKAA